jgi:hypothetical protein
MGDQVSKNNTIQGYASYIKSFRPNEKETEVNNFCTSLT